MFIVTITDAEGMTYVEAFREMKKARAFVPPAWAKLKSPVAYAIKRFTSASDSVGETIHV